MRLENRVAVIAGVGRGMGAATALLFAQEGARVVMAARNTGQVETVAARIRAAGGEVLVVQADLTDEHGPHAVVEKAVSAYGGLDIYLSLAGGFFRFEKSVLETEPDFLDRVLANHLRTIFYGVRAAAPHIRARGGGAMVTFAAGYKTRRDGTAAYGAAKDGVIGFTRNLARELHADNIRVNCIAPGLIRLPLRDGAIELPEAELARRGQPEDIAYAALYLASDESRWVTGQVLAVDGGDEVYAGQPRDA
jgi:NAD(P)-dependent dehydrogenase (short-subunit alcohol dehydrogenase family)